jgi:hypothetical protein
MEKVSKVYLIITRVSIFILPKNHLIYWRSDSLKSVSLFLGYLRTVDAIKLRNIDVKRGEAH